MRNRCTYNLLFILLITSGISLKAQKLTLPSSPGEKVVLVADRSVYAVSEKIQFSASYFIEADFSDDALSTVLYAELIRWNGDNIVQTKIAIEDGRASGSITIPSDLLSGNYYLRAYTKWMRNFTVRDYAYLPIRIVNPYRKRTDPGPLPGDESACVLRRTPSEGVNNDWIEGLQDEYGQRKDIAITVNFPEDLAVQDYAVSLVKLGTSTSEICSSEKKESAARPDKSLEYYPEIHGMTLTGMLVNQQSNAAVADELLNLSTISSSEYFSAVNTDKDGRFIFMLPQMEGVKEVSLSVKDAEKKDVKLFVDAPFCSKPVRLPFVSFNLSEKNIGLENDIVRNMEISNRIALIHEEETSSSDLAFFGHATRVIHEKEYIELEDLREFIFELVFEARVRELDDGTPGIYTTSYHTLSTSPMLVLMDNMPVSDLDELLNVSCRRIERMEIYNRGYVVGKNFYGGILSIYSEGKDMAGIKPDERSMFFDFQMFAPGENAASILESGSERLPQRRNTLFWSAGSMEDSEGPISIHCQTGDEKGVYEVVVVAVTEAGERKIVRQEFRVN